MFTKAEKENLVTGLMELLQSCKVEGTPDTYSLFYKEYTFNIQLNDAQSKFYREVTIHIMESLKELQEKGVTQAKLSALIDFVNKKYNEPKDSLAFPCLIAFHPEGPFYDTPLRHYVDLIGIERGYIPESLTFHLTHRPVLFACILSAADYGIDTLDINVAWYLFRAIMISSSDDHYLSKA